MNPFMRNFLKLSTSYHALSPERVRQLSELIPPEIIQQALPFTETVTLRRWVLPLESTIWPVMGMSVFSNCPITEIVDLMYICDLTWTPSPCAVQLSNDVKHSVKTSFVSYFLLPAGTGIIRPHLYSVDSKCGRYWRRWHTLTVTATMKLVNFTVIIGKYYWVTRKLSK